MIGEDAQVQCQERSLHEVDGELIKEAFRKYELVTGQEED